MKNSSNEAYDQPADGVKPHLNMSFNKTSESNSDASSGKTHIAQLHDTPGFTYFVDGNQRLQKTEGDKPVSSLKREVSRTWSFSTGVDAVTVNGGLSSEKPHIPNKSDNLNKISKMPSPPVHLSDPNDNKDLRHSRLPSFASKEFSEKAAAEQPPPSSDEELDENSVAAVSAAALKKAIEQAQESIRIAKMIMERKMEVLEDGSKPSSKVRSKVKGKKDTRIGHEPDVLEEKSARERHERVDPTLSTSAGIDGEFSPSLSNSDEFLNAQNAEMGRVRENVGVAKDHGDTLPEVGKEFATSCTQSETIHIAKKVEFENVEAADVRLEATNFTGLVANTEHRTENSEYEKVDDKDNLVCSTYKVESRRVEMETGKETLEQRESTIHQSKEPEIIAEMAEIAPKSSVRVEEVDEDFEQCQATVDFQKGAKNIAELWEGSPDCSQSTQEQEKTTHEAVENSKISQDDIVTEESDDLADDNGKCEEKFVEHEEMGYGEHLKVLKSDFRNLLNESQALTEKEIPEPEDTEQSEYIPAWEENSQHGKSGDEQELKEPVEEEISEREPKVSPKVEEAGQQVNVVHELEMNDETRNSGHDGLQKLPREYKPDEIADRNMDTSEFEAAQSIQMEADYYAEVLKGKFPGDAEETDRNARSEEDQDESKIRETDSDEEYDEAAVNARNNYSGTFSSATDSTDTSTIFSEAQEPCDVELNNKSEEHQEAVNGYEESDRLDEVTDTFSVTEDSEAGKPLHLDVNEMPRTTSMHKCASDENLMGSTLKNTFEGLSADSKTENISLMDTDHEETLQEDEDMFEKANQVHTAAPEYAAEINEQNLPEVRTSSNKVEEFDYTNVKPVPERNPASSEGSASTSILENVDDVSVHEAQACAENAKDNTSTKEEVGDGPDMTSDDKEDVEEQCELIYSEDQNEGAYSQSNCDVTEEKGEDMEMNKENLGETSTIAQKDSKLNEQKFETDDPQQRIEAIKRGREREKDRMAVERAIREARERAFAEARERAERAAVEKAAAEARQRFMKEAREKLEKTSVETKQPVDKASTEVKLRAERAAVERATAEARERALEKAMSQRTSIEARAQGDRHPSERVSSSSRNNGLKHSFSSSVSSQFCLDFTFSRNIVADSIYLYATSMMEQVSCRIWRNLMEPVMNQHRGVKQG